MKSTNSLPSQRIQERLRLENILAKAIGHGYNDHANNPYATEPSKACKEFVDDLMQEYIGCKKVRKVTIPKHRV